MNRIVKEDIKRFVDSFSFANELTEASFLITGATGLIGKTLVECLLELKQDISITIPVRNKTKAEQIFGADRRELHIIECALSEYLNTMEGYYDYIVHLASPTSGKYICQNPIATYEFAIETTKALLHYASKHEVKGMVYVSSLEYYGQNADDRLIDESFLGYVDMASARSAYPMGKRAAEYLCTSYALEKNAPVKIARLTQTFGAGVAKDDNRVFAQLARSIIKGEDIVLHTKGESAKPYCYTTDCVSAILYILLKGRNGEAYNVANEETYISIFEMAEFLCKNFNPNIEVRIELHPEMGYAPVTKLHLSADKLLGLGWKPKYNLKEMYSNLIQGLKDETKN